VNFERKERQTSIATKSGNEVMPPYEWDAGCIAWNLPEKSDQMLWYNKEMETLSMFTL
jgi:hypothetical protein